MAETLDRLDSWAAIAAHLGRDVRTAKRYEAERGMPVHRPPGGGKAAVYAFRTELDAWLRRGREAAAPSQPDLTAPADAGPREPARATRGAIERRRPAWVVPGLAAGVLTLAAAGALLPPPAAKPREQTAVVVAALQNDTSEPVLERLVPRLLQIDLTQSPQLQVAGDAKVAQVLALMERPRDTALTSAVAREVCVRGNGGVWVAPGAARLGGSYILTLSVSDCVSGRVVSQDREVVASRDDVPAALDRLAARSRHALGESRASVSRFDVPIAPARTASFDALHAYSEAMWLAARAQDVPAVPLFRRAVELDAGFGLAWLGLAQTYYHARQWSEDADAMTHAYALRGSMSERDGLFTAYRYHLVVEKDLVAARASLEALALLYPHDAAVLSSLSALHLDLGQYGPAIDAAEQAMRADPRSAPARTILMRALTRSGRPERAKALGLQAASDKVVDSRLYEQRILAEIELGNIEGARRLLEAVTGKQFERDARLQYAAVFGDGRAAAFDAMVDEADLLGRRAGVRMDWPAVAGALADLGADERARRRLALVEPELRVAKYHRAKALVGDPAQEEAELAQDEARWPKDTLRNAEFGPEARAILALRRGDAQAAVRATSAPDPYEWRTPEFPYIRAVALLAARDGPAAATAFGDVLAHPGWSNWPQYSLSHLGLARALRLQRDFGGARREYDAFLYAWRRADADLPQPGEARSERSTLPS